MRRRERDVRETFRRAQALDPASARPLADLGMEESSAFRRLRRHEVVRESSPGCFYFEEDAWQALRGMRMRMAAMLIFTLLIAGLVIFYAMPRTF